MATILTTPVEIRSRIFQACHNFQDVISLASTCKSMNHVWQSEAPAIIWGVGNVSIIAFDVALLVIRATEIVREALADGVLPQPISINMLSGSLRRPSIEEYRKILDLQYFVRSRELSYTFRLRSLRTMELSDEDYPHLMAKFPNWNQNFYRSIYRTFLAGAVCFRAYQEPLSVDKDIFGKFLQMLRANKYDDVDFPDIGLHCPFTDDDIDKLVHFPVFCFEKYDAMKSDFDEFTTWFLEDCGLTQGDLAQNVPGRAQGKDRVVLLEIARFLFVSATPLDMSYVHRREVDPDSSDHTHGRKVDIVLFGTFQLQRYSIVGNINTVFAPPSYLTILMPTYNSVAHNSPDIKTLLTYLHICSRQPNHRDECPGVMPPLQLLEYILRTGCDLRFANEAFMEDSGSKSYYNLVYNYEVLSDDGDIALDFAQDAKDVPVLSYEYMD